MHELILDGKQLYPIRLIPYATGWKIAPDVLARIFAERDGFYHIKIPTFHIMPDGSYKPMFAKEWDTIITDLEILTSSLKSKETSEDENYKTWRTESVWHLTTGTFVWLEDLIAAYNSAFSKERMTLDNEREGDRKLNLTPALPIGVSNIIYEGFEPLIPKLSNVIKTQNIDLISFTDLHHILNLDLFYGLQSAATDAFIADFYRNSINKTERLSFRFHFDCIPCKGKKQLEMIYLWCGFLGLPTYHNGEEFKLNSDVLLKNWEQDFYIKLDHLKTFLRENDLPLPSALFPNDSDTTDIRSEAEEEGKNKAFFEFNVVIPELEKDLEELKCIKPDSMQDRRDKQIEIKAIEEKIEKIKNDGLTIKETPIQRRERLKSWLKEEDLKNHRGAKQRTAKREGITRQRLSQIILNTKNN